MAINEKLLKILACPQCRDRVEWDERLGGIICVKCKLIYEVKNDIPVMLINEGKQFHKLKYS